MKIRLLRPDRNETPHLWLRLESGVSAPVMIFAVTLIGSRLLWMENRSFKIIGTCVVLLAFCLSIAQMLIQKRTLSVLKKRQNKELEQSL